MINIYFRLVVKIIPVFRPKLTLNRVGRHISLPPHNQLNNAEISFIRNLFTRINYYSHPNVVTNFKI